MVQTGERLSVFPLPSNFVKMDVKDSQHILLKVYYTILHHHDQQTADEISFYIILQAERLKSELYDATHCVATILDTTIRRQSMNIFPMNSFLKIFLNAAKK